jgi:hypothetical protein
MRNVECGMRGKQRGSSSFRVGKEILTADDKTSFSSPFATLTQDAKIAKNSLNHERHEYPECH